MSHAYFIHFQGLAQAGPALIAALEAALRSEHAEGSILHAPVVLPGTDPLPVDPDDRLALCQLSQSSLLDPHTSNAIATRLDAIGRAIPGVQTIAHQTMAVERFRTAPEPSTSIVSPIFGRPGVNVVLGR